MFGTSRKSSTSTITPKPKHTPQKSDQSPKFQNPSTGVPEEVMDKWNLKLDSICTDPCTGANTSKFDHIYFFRSDSICTDPVRFVCGDLRVYRTSFFDRSR